MTVDRELLWNAYPDGYLAMKGVSTVEGYVVRESQSTPGAFFWCRDAIFDLTPEHPRHAWVEARDWGDLLPDLDPEGDPATWACALRDLALAVNWTAEQPNLAWFLSPPTVHGAGIWTLHATPNISYGFGLIDIGCDRPTALAMARAQLREEAK